MAAFARRILDDSLTSAADVNASRSFIAPQQTSYRAQLLSVTALKSDNEMMACIRQLCEREWLSLILDGPGLVPS